ncbi:MAG: homoserine kinase [Nitriliruptorales bacterium]|nr:homoserine kinase [Nitriliruptorales bacterium]
MRPDERVGVQVPASSANLGPGFDALAVALDLPLIAWTTDREERRVLAEGEGADELPAGEENLVWRALVAYCDWAGTPPPEISVRVRSAIPLQRGLGSSAAAAVAGAALARAFTGGGGGDQDLIDLAAALEGHADNAAAAVLGGLCVVVDGCAHRLEPSETLRPIACIPTARQSTEAARGLLPDEIPLGEAAANAARTATVLAGLSGTMAWRPEAMRDILHEPPRLAAMVASGALVEAVRSVGLGACLSGAGPSVLVIAPAGNGEAASLVARLAGPDWMVRSLRWDRAGAEVCPQAIVAVRE